MNANKSFLFRRGLLVEIDYVFSQGSALLFGKIGEAGHLRLRHSIRNHSHHGLQVAAMFQWLPQIGSAVSGTAVSPVTAQAVILVQLVSVLSAKRYPNQAAEARKQTK
jgi:hypothetical protein